MNTINIFKKQMQDMMNADYRSFIEALVSIETGENDKDGLRALYDLYDLYMESDDVILLNDFFYK